MTGIQLYDYSRWPNFSRDKLLCSHTGLENPNQKEFIDLMDKTQALRTWYGHSMIETSGYRHPTHPNERHKEIPGQHTIAAIDFRVVPWHTHKIVKKMFELGFTGIGVNLTGDKRYRFIHGDNRPGNPALWSY